MITDDEARKIIVDEWKAANGYDDLLSAYSMANAELLAARKVVDAARHVPGGVFGDNATKATALAGLSAALFEYDKAVRG